VTEERLRLYFERSNPMKQSLRHGFTLIELLVVIAIIGILSAMLLPVLSRAKQRAQGALCLGNGRQLMTALHMYIADNNDLFPPNPDDGNTVPGYNWCPGDAGIGQANEFNSDVLLDPNRSLLVNYLSQNAAIFRCPADRREGTYQGTNPAFIGKTVPAARTFSMSQAVGTVDPGFDQNGSGHSGIPNLPVNGPWLDSHHGSYHNNPWRTYGKAANIAAPGPSMLWVFIDEDARYLNDAAFGFGMETPNWVDAPGTYHNRGCGFAFADGHSETHSWLYKGVKERGPVSDSKDEQDWEWMAARTSALAQ